MIEAIGVSSLSSSFESDRAVEGNCAFPLVIDIVVNFSDVTDGDSVVDVTDED